jgi:hypothetical protein
MAGDNEADLPSWNMASGGDKPYWEYENQQQQKGDVVKVYTSAGPYIESYNLRLLDPIKCPSGADCIPLGGQFEITYTYTINIPTDGTNPAGYGRIESITPKGKDTPPGQGTFADSFGLGLVKSSSKVIGEGKEAITIQRTDLYQVKDKIRNQGSTTGRFFIEYQIAVTDPVNRGAIAIARTTDQKIDKKEQRVKTSTPPEPVLVKKIRIVR